MTISCYIWDVSLPLRAFISDPTPRTFVARFEAEAMMELIMSPIDCCFDVNLSRSWSMSANQWWTVKRMEINPEAATDCPFCRGIGLLATVVAELSSSIAISLSVTKSSHTTSLYDNVKGAFILFHGGCCITFILISVAMKPHIFL
jgi:hypothetical protein